jgi:hypothetical protein
MTITGDPVWARNAGIADYGGHTSKADYMSQGAVNPKTDLSAAGFKRMTDHLAACARTADICKIQFTQDDTTPDDPTVNSCDCLWGYAGTSYPGDAPPTNFPTVIRQSDGYCLITFDSSYDDEYGQSADLDIRYAVPAGNDSGNTNVVCDIVNAYTVAVRCFVGNTGAAATDKSVTVVIG